MTRKERYQAKCASMAAHTVYKVSCNVTLSTGLTAQQVAQQLSDSSRLHLTNITVANAK